MTASSPFRLGVDLGTSTTIAMLRWPDGRVRPLLFDGSPLLSSAVLLGPDGHLYTGRDAAHLARGNPERLEPNPKRRIDDDLVLLGDAEVPVRELLAAVLRRVAAEAGRVAGQIGAVTLTHPAAWGARRCGLLVEAAQRAGLRQPHLVSEPEAAATYFANMMDATGSRVLVYDLGAGTCDVTLLRRHQYGFEMVASDGLNDVGGLDVDAAIVAFLEASYGRIWHDAASRRQLWDEVRTAKEMLSRTSGTVIAIPALGKEVPLGREQFDGLVGPVLRPTVAMTKALLRDAGTGTDGPTALLLVGGASRIPLVATLLYEAVGLAPIVTEQPELVVAEGALSSAAATGVPAPARPVAPLPVAPLPVAPLPVSGGPVSGGPVSGGPVSGGPDMPVSGGFGSVPDGFGPVGQVSGGFGLPSAPVSSGYPQPAAPPVVSPAATPRRSRLAVVAGVLAALALVVAATTAALVWSGRVKPGPASGGTAGAGAGPTASTPGRYAVSLLPENLCDKVEVGRLGSTFESEAAPSQHSRNLTTVVGTATCTVLRQHGTAIASASITFTAFIYADTNLAVAAQKQNLDNAKLNDPKLGVVTGLGDEAFVNRMPSGTSAKDAHYALEARDGNLRWTVYLIATRVTGSAWTDQERSQLVSDLEAAAKATQAKLASR
jgi:Hsp70 protein